ncbi:MAG: polysaccharide biosynthesis/export family protein [Terracidiphilus sp.]
MRSRTFFIATVLAAGLSCSAQSKGPATPPAPAATPVAAPAHPAASASAKDTYIIGGSDVLSINVWKQPTLSGSLLVRPDGMISLPLVGDVQAAGLTPPQLAHEITERLWKYIQDPNVSVVVTAIHSKMIYMIGEVAKTGPVEMTPDMTLLEAISSAGGLTEFANKKKMYLLRDVGGKRQKILLHYKEALKGNQTYDLPLEAGDTIVVP